MLKRFLNIVTCIAVVFLLLLNGTAHEFLHTFSGHKDTVDCAHREDGATASFEQQHHHCDFLDLQSPVFLASSFSFSLFIPTLHNDYYVGASLLFFSRQLGHTALRGPPAG